MTDREIFSIGMLVQSLLVAPFLLICFHYVPPGQNIISWQSLASLLAIALTLHGSVWVADYATRALRRRQSLHARHTVVEGSKNAQPLDR